MRRGVKDHDGLTEHGRQGDKKSGKMQLMLLANGDRGAMVQELLGKADSGSTRSMEIGQRGKKGRMRQIAQER